MENKELMERLMEGQQDHQSDVGLPIEPQVLISSARVVSIRYKVYVAVLLVFLVVGWLNYVQPKFDEYMLVRSQLQDMERQITSFSTKKSTYEADKDLITLIQQQESTILSCLNQRVCCAHFDARLRANNGKNFSVARSFIQLGNLSDPKMEINEKIILANVNEFLLKNAGVANGILESISLGDSTLVKDHLYMIPVTLVAKFSTKDSLLAFIDNIEQKVLSDSTYRILYKIKEIGYDVMNYQQEQSVSVALSAYYYQE